MSPIADSRQLDTAYRASTPTMEPTTASAPRRAPDRLPAVGPSWTLLMVRHDPAPMLVPIDTGVHSRMFDAGAFVGIDDLAKALAADPAWSIELHEQRPRPAGAASAAHHVDDIVFRARRTR